MTDLPLSDHPLHRRQPATPADVAGSRLALVPGGATAATGRTDALISLDHDELTRRTAVGLGSVTALHLLDGLLNLPLGYPIALDDLTSNESRVLREAPVGCVDFTSTSATRTLRVPVTVAAAVVRGFRWRTALRRVAPFAPFTQRIVVLASAPSVSTTLEARLTGVGIWIDAGGGQFDEAVAPEPFVPNYFKAAGWRFAENAYRRALGAAWPALGSRWAACC